MNGRTTFGLGLEHSDVLGLGSHRLRDTACCCFNLMVWGERGGGDVNRRECTSVLSSCFRTFIDYSIYRSLVSAPCDGAQYLTSDMFGKDQVGSDLLGH